MIKYQVLENTARNTLNVHQIMSLFLFRLDIDTIYRSQYKFSAVFTTFSKPKNRKTRHASEEWQTALC